jgi:hypothetical protein
MLACAHLGTTVLIFGDPMNGTAVGSIPAAKTKVICHTGDNICEGGNRVLQPHLTVSLKADIYHRCSLCISEPMANFWFR